MAMAAPHSVVDCVGVPHGSTVRLLPGCVLRNDDTCEEVPLLTAPAESIQTEQGRHFLVALAAEVATAAGGAHPVALAWGGTAGRAFLRTNKGVRAWANDILTWSSWQDAAGRRFAIRRGPSGVESRWRTELSCEQQEFVTSCGERVLGVIARRTHHLDCGFRYFWSMGPLVTSQASPTSTRTGADRKALSLWATCTARPKYQLMGFNEHRVLKRQGAGASASSSPWRPVQAFASAGLAVAMLAATAKPRATRPGCTQGLLENFIRTFAPADFDFGVLLRDEENIVLTDRAHVLGADSTYVFRVCGFGVLFESLRSAPQFAALPEPQRETLCRLKPAPLWDCLDTCARFSSV